MLPWSRKTTTQCFLPAVRPRQYSTTVPCWKRQKFDAIPRPSTHIQEKGQAARGAMELGQPLGMDVYHGVPRLVATSPTWKAHSFKRQRIVGCGW